MLIIPAGHVNTWMCVCVSIRFCPATDRRGSRGRFIRRRVIRDRVIRGRVIRDRKRNWARSRCWCTVLRKWRWRRCRRSRTRTSTRVWRRSTSRRRWISAISIRHPAVPAVWWAVTGNASRGSIQTWWIGSDGELPTSFRSDGADRTPWLRWISTRWRCTAVSWWRPSPLRRTCRMNPWPDRGAVCPRGASTTSGGCPACGGSTKAAAAAPSATLPNPAASTAPPRSARCAGNLRRISTHR